MVYCTYVYSYWDYKPTLRMTYNWGGHHSNGHLLVITGFFYGIIHSMNWVFLVLITGITRALTADGLCYYDGTCHPPCCHKNKAGLVWKDRRPAATASCHGNPTLVAQEGK